MKKHKKQVKLSRIRKVSFKRELNRIRRKKNPKGIASQMYNSCVINNTIPKADESSIIEIKMPWGTIKGTKGGEWKNPKEGFRQPKPMMKKHTELVYNKETHMTEKVKVASTFPDPHAWEKHLWKNLTKQEKIDINVNHKMERWERKHPCPVNTDPKQKDIFESQYLPQWEADREQAEKRIRDFVVSLYDKLPLIGRYKKSESEFTEKQVTELKDVKGEGNKVNELNPKKSRLLKIAKKETNKEKKKNPNLVCTNLKDHKRKKGRIILPEAA